MRENEECKSTDIAMLERLAHGDKKITKKHIKEINIVIMLKNININKLSLKQASVIIVGIAKAISKKYKILIEDCNSLLQLFASKQLGTSKGVRIPSSKPITLSIDNNLMVVEEELFEEENILEMAEADLTFMDRHDTMIENGQPVFEADFGNSLSIEQARNSTLVGSEAFPDLDLVNVTLKRRKIAEDGITEFEETLFKGNLRSVSDILLRVPTEILENKLKPTIRIDDKIKTVFDRIKVEGEEVEEKRMASTMMDDFGFNPIETAEQMSISEVDLKPVNSTLILEELPESFIFNALVENLSASDKAAHFSSMLSAASTGRIAVAQENAFAPIKCKKTNSSDSFPFSNLESS